MWWRSKWSRQTLGGRALQAQRTLYWEPEVSAYVGLSRSGTEPVWLPQREREEDGRSIRTSRGPEFVVPWRPREYFHYPGIHTHSNKLSSYLFCFVLFYFIFGCPMAPGVPWPGIRSEPQFWPTLQVQQHQILLSTVPATDQTYILALQRHRCSHCSMEGTPEQLF